MPTSEFNQHAAWPTDDDIAAPAGATSGQVTAARLAAIATFKRAVRYPVFIAGVDNDGLPSTEYFDGDGTGLLKLGGGYVSISSVKAGITYTDGVLNTGSGAVVYAPNTFRLRHEPDSSGPITWLESSVCWGWGVGAGIVAVTGVRGAYTYCPDDVWQAIIAKTQSLLYPSARQAVAGYFSRVSAGQGEAEAQFASSKDGPQATWEAEWDRAVARYKRT